VSECPPPPLSPPPPPPFAVHTLDTGDGHRLHVEEHGHPQGRPLLLLHGGPGSGCSPMLRRPFDLSRWRLICPDQRGSGRSQPGGETRANGTEHLLADLRRLRRQLGLERWCVAGGSWGATLALLHTLDEPVAVDALLLRAVFLARDADVAGFFDGAVDLAAGCGARAGEPLAVALDRPPDLCGGTADRSTRSPGRPWARRCSQCSRAYGRCRRARGSGRGGG
jgi:pimeloyl-ACP methyl ester carboxylesterase